MHERGRVGFESRLCPLPSQVNLRWSGDENGQAAPRLSSNTARTAANPGFEAPVSQPYKEVSMRIVAATICALTLAGCASNLPYSIAIGDPSTGRADQHEKHCVLRLDDIVEKVAKDNSSSTPTVRSLQIQFENKLHEDTQALEHCKDSNSSFVKYHPIEKVSKKWLTTYALDATDPDQDLDRFREYLLSAQLVEKLAKEPLLPEEKEYSLVELPEQSESLSQWCGLVGGPKNDSPCFNERSLYHVQAKLTAPPHQGETAEDLYKYLLTDIVPVERKGTQRNPRYFVLGYEIPWDKERTLVRYGVAFYFRQTAPEKAVDLIGYDLTYANEATPAPIIARGTDGASIRTEEKSPWIEPLILAGRFTGYPFSLVIGLKNAAFEIVKLPFSLIAGPLFGRDVYNYPIENIRTAWDALRVEANLEPQSQPRWGALGGLYRLLTEMPLVGQLFQYNFGFDRSEPDQLPPVADARRKIFLSRGIYGGNKWGQDTGLWTLFARQSYPTYDIYSPPYRHGTATDAVWSMFNLSHGPAYSEARYIMDQATRDDRLYLAGHSGGVQRSAAASRILSNHGYRVVKVVGIAGPSIGQALVDPRYPEAFTVYLNTGSGANQDVTSKIGAVAGAFSTLLDYTVIVPLKYTIGSLGGLVIRDRKEAYRTADRFGFSNATIVEVTRKPSSQHQTPMRLSFTDRLVFDAYIRNEFATAFKEDLERPDDPHETDRPYAFPWER